MIDSNGRTRRQSSPNICVHRGWWAIHRRHVSIAITSLQPELNWAVWSSLIHGARGIIYFNHTFAGPAHQTTILRNHTIRQFNRDRLISIYTQVKKTDALIEQLAPVLNSPTALGYVTVNGPGYVNGTVVSQFSGIEIMAKDYNGQFYIFADTRDSETQTNIPATFTIADHNATSVTVVNENRTIPVVNGVFTDTFATAATVHIYQVNDGPGSPGSPGAPAAPLISAFSPDTAPVGDGHTTATSITLTGTGEANSTVNVFDGTTSVGQASVNASGAWSLLDSGLAVGPHSFTATDTDANGTSAASAVFAITVDAPTAPPPPPSSSNLVVNGGFETGDFAGWTTSGNVAQLSIGPQLFITSTAHSGQDAAGFGSVGSDGTISQALTTVVGQSYTLDFWLANTAGGPNDFTAKIGGVTELHLVNAAAQPYTHYDFTFTATSTSTPLEFDFRQDPSEWQLDDVSVVQATGSPPPPPPTSGIDTVAPAKPIIASFGTDSGIQGDGITNDHTLTLTGTAEANTTVKLYDGTALLGTAAADGSGAWNYATGNLLDGTHNFTATDTDAAGNVSTASTVLPVTVATPGADTWKVNSMQDSHGTAELLWTDTSAGTHALWMMNGTNVTGGAALPNTGPSWHVEGVGDFNGDGTADILWQNDDGTPAIWTMNGTTPTGGAALPNPGPSWHVKDAADFNGDGTADILWQNDDGTPAIWTMNGTNSDRRSRAPQSWTVVACQRRRRLQRRRCG